MDWQGEGLQDACGLGSVPTTCAGVRGTAGSPPALGPPIEPQWPLQTETAEPRRPRQAPSSNQRPGWPRAGLFPPRRAHSVGTFRLGGSFQGACRRDAGPTWPRAPRLPGGHPGFRGPCCPERAPAKLTCSLRTVASLHRCRFWEAPPDLTRWRWRPLRVCRPLLPRPSTLRMPPGSSLAKDLEAAPLWGAGPRPQLHLLRGNLSTLGRPHPLPTPGVPWTAQPLRGPWLLCKRSVPGRMPVRAEGLVVTQWDS